MKRIRVLGVVLMVAMGCGDDDTTVDAAGVDASSGMDAPGMDALTVDAPTLDAPSVDAPSVDAPSVDAPSVDAPGEDAGSTDSGSEDVGADAPERCEGFSPGVCPDDGTSCLSCPAGGPRSNHLCTTECRNDGDCPTLERPHCNRPTMGGGGMGICTARDFACAWGAVCASPDTPIATPDGERAIADLAVGDLIYTMEDDEIVVRPLVQIGRTRVHEHRVVRLVLETGTVEMSAGHPTIDGRTFGDLAAGDWLGEVEILAIEEIPFAHPYTHDILPDSSTGAYFAQGAAVGSTLAPARESHPRNFIDAARRTRPGI